MSHFIVAAIDFGTTNSGYAFSTKNDFETSPLKISAVSWTSGSERLQSQKTPTCVLFDSDQNFHSFGYDAEDKYSDLALEDEQSDWYFFRRFKMELYTRKELDSGFELQAQNGKTMKAMDVFSACINYLKEHMLQTANKQGLKLENGDIQWVLTVPAIWTEPGKQFMRKAANKAGIADEDLKLVLEPEAAAIYCTNLPIDRISVEGSENKMTVFQPGTKYMVLDAGGGTVDITIQEVQRNGSLKELYKANGGEWGGASVDQEFEQLLQDIVGQDLFKTFKVEYISDVVNLYRNFELKKRQVKKETNGSVTFRIPPILQMLFEKSTKGRKTAEALSGNKKYSDIFWKSDKFRIPEELAKGLFNKTLDAIAKHIKEIFTKKEVGGVSIILMVGGFSECELLQNKVREVFPDKKIIVPNEAGLAILKGAVINGHMPNIVTSRVCRYTYAVACNRAFIPGVDKEENKVKGARGDDRCQDALKLFVSKGTSIQLGETIKKFKFSVSNPRETGIDLPIYASEESEPRHVTDQSCQRLGMLRIEMPDISSGIDRHAEVEMLFGGTELEVKAIDLETKRQTKASFNFVG